MSYPDEIKDSEIPNVDESDGDGKVNLKSLEGCLKWTNGQEQLIQHKKFNGTNHRNILFSHVLINYLRDIFKNEENGSKDSV